MAEFLPIAAQASLAAKLMDMKPEEFRASVKDGHLPRPRLVAGVELWDVKQLQRIVSGDAAEGMGDVAW